MMQKFFLLAISLLLPFSSFAEEEKQTPDLPETIVETEGVVTIDGRPLAYQTKAGTLTLKGEDDKPKMSLFYVAYTKKGGDAKRPLTFCFNGGPGSSSVWLHMGMFGPRRVDFNDEGTKVVSPNLIDNSETLLDLTDLVFIDPVSCGYSRAACAEDAKQFYSVDEDIKWIAEFIRLYLTREGRWASPRYLAGESYGTTRAVGLSEQLLSNQFISVDGMILISTILNFQTLKDPQAGNDLPYPLFLPTYTAAAWYHNRLPQELQQKPLDQVLEKVETFSLTEYAQGLMQGDRLSPEKRKYLTKKLSYYTALPEDLIERNQRRIEWTTFVSELNKGKFIGRFDSRVQGVANKDEPPFVDPSLYALASPFTTVINYYLRETIKWEKDDPYRIIANVYPWDFGKSNNQFLNMSKSLVYTLSRNPKTRVFIASGLYDLATPYFATDYTLNHLGLDASLKENITTKTYPGGHMLYSSKPAREQLKADLTNFYKTR